MSYPPQPPAGQYPPPQPPGGYPAGQYPPAGPPASPGRPWNVTLVAIIALLIGLFDIAVGIVVLLYRNDAEFLYNTSLTPSEALTLGLVTLVVGAITLLLSFGLFGGSRLARGVIALLEVVRIAFGVYALIVAIGTTRLSAVIEITIAVVVLLLLFAGQRTKAFFARG